jgi:hypothetical protein
MFLSRRSGFGGFSFLLCYNASDPLVPLRLDNEAAKTNGSCFIGTKMNRNVSYRKFWNELVSIYGSRCFYCRKEIATTIDHVVPYSYDMDNDINNLVPACALCNSLAGNKHFESVEHKRQYILKQRKTRKNKLCICIRCLLPFAYREHSPSLLLCAECYDEEYGKKLSKRQTWKDWLALLHTAGIPAEAHRSMKVRTGCVREITPEQKVEVLIDEYAEFVAKDEEFARLMCLV